jgi:hypothetical protein
VQKQRVFANDSDYVCICGSKAFAKVASLKEGCEMIQIYGVIMLLHLLG